MKYILVATGLLFSLNAFALFSGDTNGSKGSSSASSFSIKGSDDDTTQGFSRPMCKSFCDQYHVGVQTCDVQITGSSHSKNAPADAQPATSSGNSLGLTYNIVCDTAPTSMGD